ncbi:hypothetical protein LCGC14_0713590 [marine sediment metagenome]|uniref:Uncharacterized protein n=1 Tax=marine sediment metagenome TaxID=412755 RepID=A0A0F9TLV7_9ZZZZ
MKTYPESHQQGTILIENVAIVTRSVEESPLQTGYHLSGDIGIQIAKDGRIWVCIDGIAFIRFSPHPDGKMERTT